MGHLRLLTSVMPLLILHVILQVIGRIPVLFGTLILLPLHLLRPGSLAMVGM